MRPASFIERRAQPSDMHVDRAWAKMNRARLGGILQLIPGIDLPGIPDEMLQEAEFSRGEMNGAAIAAHTVAREVNLEIEIGQQLQPWRGKGAISLLRRSSPMWARRSKALARVAECWIRYLPPTATEAKGGSWMWTSSGINSLEIGNACQ